MWFSGPYVKVVINGNIIQAFLDTGAFNTIVADDFMDKMFAGNPPTWEKYAGQCLDASGNSMNILGKVRTNIVTPNGNFQTEILVYKKCPRTEHQLLIGMDILSNSILDLSSRKLSFMGKTKNAQGVNGLKYDLEIEFPCTDISGTPRSILQTNPKDLCQGSVNNDGNKEPIVAKAGIKPCKKSVDIYIKEELVVPPNHLYTFNIRQGNLRNNMDLVVNQNILYEILLIPNIVTTIIDKAITINIANFSDSQFRLQAGTRLAGADYVNEVTSPSQPHEWDDVARYRPLTSEDVYCDDICMKQELLKLLNKYRNICWIPGEPLGHYTGDKLKIQLKEDIIINKAPYRVPYALQAPLQEAIDDMLDQGVITKSKSSFNSPLIIVKKAGGGEYAPAWISGSSIGISFR